MQEEQDILKPSGRTRSFIVNYLFCVVLSELRVPFFLLKMYAIKSLSYSNTILWTHQKTILWENIHQPIRYHHDT